MTRRLNAEELLKIACGIERKGMLFYRKTVEFFPRRKDIRDKLLELVEWEQEHEEIFRDMIASLKDHEKQPSAVDLDENTDLYLETMIDGLEFDLDDFLGRLLTEGDALSVILDKGMELEQKSITYYLGMRIRIPVHLGKERVDEIIDEEMRHVADLRRMKDSLTGS